MSITNDTAMDHIFDQVESLDLSSASVLQKYLAECKPLATEYRRKLQEVNNLKRRAVTSRAYVSLGD